MVLGVGRPTQGTSIRLRGQTPASPMSSLVEEDGGLQEPALPSKGRQGQVSDKEGKAHRKCLLSVVSPGCL